MTNSSTADNSGNVTTALLLAAGTGTRLQPLTLNTPKCLTKVGGIPILEQLVEHLRAQGFKRLVVVIGYLGDRIREFLREHAGDMQIDYVVNPDYQTTNNLYSLWLARQQIREPFLLMESDLVFEGRMLKEMLQPDKIAISTILPWMNGTTIELGLDRRVSTFHLEGKRYNDVRQYKTVNLYSLSLQSWNKVEERLSHYIDQGRLSDYYEVVFSELVADGALHFDAVIFDADKWYEIDTMVDLRNAEALYIHRCVISNRALITSDMAQTLA